MVDLTSVILAFKSSAWETGVGNFPAVKIVRNAPRYHCLCFLLTLGKTGTQETRNLLDERVGGKEGVIFAGELLDHLLVLVELLQVIGGHGVNTVVLRAIDIVLVTENAV